MNGNMEMPKMKSKPVTLNEVTTSRRKNNYRILDIKSIVANLEDHSACFDSDQYSHLNKPEIWPKRFDINDLEISFSGCGYLGIYHLGVAAAFQYFVPGCRFARICGTSAGALAAGGLACGVSLDTMATSMLEAAEDARSYWGGPFHPEYRITASLRIILNQLFPEHCHKMSNGRLFISTTKINFGITSVCENYTSKSELIDVLTASAFIPAFSGAIPHKYRGQRVIDGGFSTNLIQLTPDTITVSPIASDVLICPQDETRRRKWDIQRIYISQQGTDITITNLQRLKNVLFPPPAEVLSKFLENGFRDAHRFLRRNGYAPCHQCEMIRLRSEARLNYQAKLKKGRELIRRRVKRKDRDMEILAIQKKEEITKYAIIKEVREEIVRNRERHETGRQRNLRLRFAYGGDPNRKLDDGFDSDSEDSEDDGFTPPYGYCVDSVQCDEFNDKHLNLPEFLTEVLTTFTRNAEELYSEYVTDEDKVSRDYAFFLNCAEVEHEMRLKWRYDLSQDHKVYRFLVATIIKIYIFINSTPFRYVFKFTSWLSGHILEQAVYMALYLVEDGNDYEVRRARELRKDNEVLFAKMKNSDEARYLKILMCAEQFLAILVRHLLPHNTQTSVRHHQPQCRTFRPAMITPEIAQEITMQADIEIACSGVRLPNGDLPGQMPKNFEWDDEYHAAAIQEAMEMDHDEDYGKCIRKPSVPPTSKPAVSDQGKSGGSESPSVTVSTEKSDQTEVCASSSGQEEQNFHAIPTTSSEGGEDDSRSQRMTDMFERILDDLNNSNEDQQGSVGSNRLHDSLDLASWIKAHEDEQNSAAASIKPTPNIIRRYNCSTFVPIHKRFSNSACCLLIKCHGEDPYSETDTDDLNNRVREDDSLEDIEHGDDDSRFPIGHADPFSSMDCLVDFSSLQTNDGQRSSNRNRRNLSEGSSMNTKRRYASGSDTVMSERRMRRRNEILENFDDQIDSLNVRKSSVRRKHASDGDKVSPLNGLELHSDMRPLVQTMTSAKCDFSLTGVNSLKNGATSVLTTGTNSSLK